MLTTEEVAADGPCGHSQFAADRCLTACNDLYRQIYDLPVHLTQPGTPLMAIVHHFIQSETGVAPPGELAEVRGWIARHVEQLAPGTSSAHAHFLNDGRVIFVRSYPQPEGGWREVHEDITEKWRAEAQVLHLHDGSHADRLAIDGRLRAALARAARGDRFAILFLEFDTVTAVKQRIGKPIEEADLRAALSDHQFELKYQPIVSLARNTIVSSEALIRWRKPDVGLILPAEFILIAEKSGFMVELGEWVLKQACGTAVYWPDPVRIAVNVAASQLETAGFANVVGAALESSSLPAARLEIEISELTLRKDDKCTLDTLREIRRMGVRIALENFGAGYSSIEQLHKFPVDIIKIDPSLINSTAAEESKEAFRAVVTLSRSLAATTTVKGIESAEQLQFAREAGCDEAQGYYICPPLPVEGSDLAWQPGPQDGHRDRGPVASDASFDATERNPQFVDDLTPIAIRQGGR